MRVIEIYFMVDGKDYAYRVWPAAPRIGERVMMHPIKGAQTHEVKDLCWGTREEESRGRVTCNVILGQGKPVGALPPPPNNAKVAGSATNTEE